MSWCQYDAYPTTWAEFITAIAQEETRVICPEDAVWDANDFCPEGFENQTWQINCDQILGRGLTIKNLKLTDCKFKATMASISGKCRLECWDGLNMINMVVYLSENENRLFDFTGRPSSIDGETVPTESRYVYINGSQFSGTISKTTSGTLFQPFGEAKLWCCACNLELHKSGGSITSFSMGRTQEYCNFRIACDGFTKFDQISGTPYGASYSWFDIYGDDLVDISGTFGAVASIFRNSCNAPTVRKAKSGFPSVVCVPDPLQTVLPYNSNLILCVDSELRNETWLAAQGFPIAVTP